MAKTKKLAKDERIIKHRLFTWFEEVESPVMPGQTVLAERIATFGQRVKITNPAYIERGEKPEIDAFYSPEEAEQIEAGTYSGSDAGLLYSARASNSGLPASAVLPGTPVAAEGEHGDVASMDSAALGEYIRERGLTPEQVLSLVPPDADEDLINKFLDAENIATDNEPRDGVFDALEAQLNAATGRRTQSSGNDQVDATDAAIRMADENNLDLSEVEGTGVGGRITVDDVKAALESGS